MNQLTIPLYLVLKAVNRHRSRRLAWQFNFECCGSDGTWQSLNANAQPLLDHLQVRPPWRQMVITLVRMIGILCKFTMALITSDALLNITGIVIQDRTDTIRICKACIDRKASH